MPWKTKLSWAIVGMLILYFAIAPILALDDPLHERQYVISQTVALLSAIVIGLYTSRRGIRYIDHILYILRRGREFKKDLYEPPAPRVSANEV